MNDLFVDFSFRSEWEKLWGRRKLLIGVCGAATLIGILFTSPWFMKPEFKSTAAIFPPSISSITQFNFSENAFRGFEAGEVEDVDRIISLLQAPSLKDLMAMRYDLYAHYGLETPKGGPALTASEKFYKVYDDKVKVSFTQFSTIQIEVFDTDSVLAAQIANDYIVYVDSFLDKVASRKEGLREVEGNIAELKVQIDSLRDSVQYYRTRYQIYQVENLSDAVATYLYQKSHISPEFHVHYDRTMALATQLFNLNLILADLQRERFFRKKHLETYPSLLHVINYAKPSGYKARPKRMIIVFTVTFSTLLLMVFWVLLMDRRKRPVLPI
jgi:hypothetical protein